MLRLTEQLFTAAPSSSFADYYERALYNHILSSLHPTRPGYVYFTPIRPGHYRVYSQPENNFWCCVGSGMENPGRYGAFIYARDSAGLFVNLFLASELTVPPLGLVLRQETSFPDTDSSALLLRLEKPTSFALRLRHPAWLPAGDFTVRINGQLAAATPQADGYVSLLREWRDGDRIAFSLPMRTTVESLPDGSAWHALFHGPILLASPAGREGLDGLHAAPGNSTHIAHGPLLPLDRQPVLLGTASTVPAHVHPDPSAGPLTFRLTDLADPAPAEGLPLVPFFRLHDQRYQLYFEITTPAAREAARAARAAAEQARADLEAATLDVVAIGEQQPESDHAFASENSATGQHEGRRWRHGSWFSYELDSRGAIAATLLVTYWGLDRGRHFTISVNGQPLATEKLDGSSGARFLQKTYPLPSSLLTPALATPGTRLTVRFAGIDGSLAGGVYEVRLVRSTR